MVDPKEIWKELQPYKDYFSADVVFDGGFSLPALIKADWEVGDFVAAWTPKFPDALRKIRNALVHAREMRMVNVISPTKANYDRLRPWIAPLSLAAMQVTILQKVFKLKSDAHLQKMLFILRKRDHFRNVKI